MAFRATFFFQEDTFGWTESLYNTAADLSTVEGQALALAAARRLFLPPSAQITGIRISDPAIRGDSTVFGNQGFGSAAWPDGPHFPWTSILVRLDTVNVQVRGRIFTRPAPEIPGAGISATNVIPGFWISQSSSWRSAIANPLNTWAIRGINPVNPTVVVKGEVNITGGILTVGTQADWLGVPGDKFRLSRVKPATPNQFACLDGTYTAGAGSTATSINALTIRGNRTSVPDTGFLRKLNPAFQLIASTTPLRYVTHRTGRPFDLPRGRRSRRPVCA